LGSAPDQIPERQGKETEILALHLMNFSSVFRSYSAQAELLSVQINVKVLSELSRRGLLCQYLPVQVEEVGSGHNEFDQLEQHSQRLCINRFVQLSSSGVNI
jgi:hypothetical protein